MSNSAGKCFPLPHFEPSVRRQPPFGCKINWPKIAYQRIAVAELKSVLCRASSLLFRLCEEGLGQFCGFFGGFYAAIWLALPVFCSLLFWGDGASPTYVTDFLSPHKALCFKALCCSVRSCEGRKVVYGGARNVSPGALEQCYRSLGAVLREPWSNATGQLEKVYQPSWETSSPPS